MASLLGSYSYSNQRVPPMPMSVPRTNPSPARPQLPTNAILHERIHPRARPNPTEPSRPRIPACSANASALTHRPTRACPTADAQPYHTNNFTPVHIRTRRSHPSLGNAHSKPHERIPHPAQTNPTFPRSPATSPASSSSPSGRLPHSTPSPHTTRAFAVRPRSARAPGSARPLVHPSADCPKLVTDPSRCS